MRIIQVAPVPCLVCGKGNTPDNDGHPVRFLDLERDVNWNDPAVLCEDCGIRVGTHFDMLTPDEKQDLEREMAKKDLEVHEALAEVDAAKRRATQAIQRTRAKETLKKAKA